ncbi:MAG: FAD-dependent oxidoreductase [Bacteroidota bacterium]
MHHVIIGNGIAGITTARHLRKLDSDCEITVISAETDHFWSRTALMYIFMGHMKFEHTKPYEDWFWPKNRIKLLNKYVERGDPDTQTLYFSDGGELKYDKLLLATGSKPNKFGWPGQDLKGVQGMVSYQDLQSMEEQAPHIRRAIIVGGGLIGIEMAEMFHSRHIPVSFLVREKSFWKRVMPPQESAMINREIDAAHGIDLRLGTELEEIIGDERGWVKAIRTKDGEVIDCEFVGLTAGVHPNLSLADSLGVETNRGFLVDEYLETSVPNIYAAGDCCELREAAPGRRGIEAIWYTGKLQGPVLAKTMTGNPTPYRQGLYFNSAKFLDIEWQTYGTVNAAPAEHEAQLYWEHADGRKGIRLIYHKDEGHIIGFNLMGIRFRKDTCLAWIAEKAHVETVLAHLEEANFDPEFFLTYENELALTYQRQTGKSVALAPVKVGGLARSIGLLVGVALILILGSLALPAGVLRGIMQGIGGLVFTIGLVKTIELLYRGSQKGFQRLRFS